MSSPINDRLRWFGAGSPLEFLKFSVVGVSGIGVNLGLYALMTRAFDMSLHVASPVAIEVSILWNFMLNDGWTFQGRTTDARIWGRLWRFHVVCGLGGVLNYLVLVILVDGFGWWDISANLVGIAVAVFAKFSLNSAWTWRLRPSASVVEE